MEDKTIKFYDDNAEKLIKQYESLKTPELYNLADLLPLRPSRVLDIGAGSGRDAAWLARQGHIVTAVEPSEKMRGFATEIHKDLSINWIDDRLPELSSINYPDGGFDFILIAAVWMHLTTDERTVALDRLTQLISPQGSIAILLRHGKGDPERPMFAIDTASEITSAHKAGFKKASLLDIVATDQLGRGDVHWEMLALSLNDEKH